MIRLVLFDIDGTLVSTGGAGVKAFARTFATIFGIHSGTERMRFAGRTDVALVREMFTLCGVEHSEANFRKFFDAYVHWLDHIIPGNAGALCPGVAEFIRDLEALPHPPKVGLLTGNIRLGAEIKLRHFNLWHVFETGAFADDHENRDEIAVVARERGSRVLQKTLHGGEIVVVGDTPHDIRCGRAIGAKVLAVATGGASLKDLQAHGPDWAVENLTQISAREVCNVTEVQREAVNSPRPQPNA